MQRIEFAEVQGIPNCYVLVPETPQDEELLIEKLDDCGVRDRMGFSKQGTTGVLMVPAHPHWDEEGKVQLQVKKPDGDANAWFWLVEIDDGRVFAWWNTQPNLTSANAWN